MTASRWRLDDRLALVTGATRGIGLATVRELAALGADLLSVSGNLCGYGADRTDGAYFSPYAAAIREAVGGKVPVECTGGVRGIGNAERLLADGCCDLIGVGRPLLSDAGFLDKWRADL